MIVQNLRSSKEKIEGLPLNETRPERFHAPFAVEVCFELIWRLARYRGEPLYLGLHFLGIDRETSPSSRSGRAPTVRENS